jgi:hypothetical protein
VKRALIRKELRELLPFAVLSVVIGLMELVAELTEQVDMRPLSTTFATLSGGSAAVFWILGFAIGTGLTTREHDDGTLAFLDGLPVSRSAVFFTKCGVTMGIVLLAPVNRMLSITMLHLLSHGSLDNALRGDLLLQLFGLQLVLICGAVLLGAALGRLRSLTWLVAAVLAVGLSLLVDRYPRAQALSPLVLVRTEVTSAGLAIDAEAVWVQAGLACVAFLIAWQGFVHTGGSRPLALARRPVVGALVSLLTAVALLAALVLWVKRMRHDDDEEDEEASAEEEPRFASSPPAQTETVHYRISYPAERAHAALELAAQADATFERVHALLGVPPGEDIDVDASGSLRNTEGTAYFGRLRLELGGPPQVALAHETTHVVAQRVAGEQRDWLWRQASVLDEGLATWVERHFDDASAERDTDALLLAALHARRELIFEELTDPARLAAVRDDTLKYPAGAAVIEALVRLHGARALPRLLHAFGDAQLPTDLQGIALWQAVFQRAGFDLGAVVDELYREVAKIAAARAAEIAALARPRVRLVTRDGRFGAQALLEGGSDTAAARLVQLRFKPTPESSFDKFDVELVAPGEVGWREDFQIAGAQICVQAGLPLERGKVLYEPWACLPTRDADPWEPPESETADPDSE